MSPDRLTNIIAACFLSFVFFVAIFSIKDDSLTMDELAHLPAGYSYLTQNDMRLNPEHPPLIKDLAAIPLLFIKGINFPSEVKDWKEDVNGQWGFGWHFLFNSGNPTDQMIFWGRIPMILILILLGFYLFKWTREIFGNEAGLLALFLFSFSPTFLAHGRLVTTDIGAALGAFISIYYFLKFLKNPSKKNLIISAVSLALAQLLKFTLILLLPIFLILVFFWTLTKAFNFKSFLKSFGIYLLRFFLLLFIAYILIWPIYLYHVWNYPLEKQVQDINVFHRGRSIPILTDVLIKASKIPFLGRPIDYLLTKWKYSSYLTDSSKILISLAKNPISRPYSQYLTGLCLVIQRGLGGNTTYFLGEVSAAGWKNYFPIVYIIKEPLAFHILTAISLLYLAFLIKKPFWQESWSRIFGWLRNHFPEFSMLVFILFYWVTSISSPLNIGVRHLLPVFPFTFLLVSGTITSWLKPPRSGIKYLILLILIFWQIATMIKIYPHFLAYFNEIAGGPNKGYLYTVDSNLDWGQDLKRLKKWVDENKIEKIYVDYFGGGDAEYYLKEKFASWRGTRDPKEIEKGGYLAVSATFLQGGRGNPVPGFSQPYHYYFWLYQYEPPIARIGYSIFVYRID